MHKIGTIYYVRHSLIETLTQFGFNVALNGKLPTHFANFTRYTRRATQFAEEISTLIWKSNHIAHDHETHSEQHFLGW